MFFMFFICKLMFITSRPNHVVVMQVVIVFLLSIASLIIYFIDSSSSVLSLLYSVIHVQSGNIIIVIKVRALAAFT